MYVCKNKTPVNELTVSTFLWTIFRLSGASYLTGLPRALPLPSPSARALWQPRSQVLFPARRDGKEITLGTRLDL